MADTNHYSETAYGILTGPGGVEKYNIWREENNKPLNFSGRHFEGLDLTGANFRGVNLTGARFDAVITKEEKRGITGRSKKKEYKPTILNGADFTDAIIDDANFHLAEMQRIEFHGRAENVLFDHADLKKAKLDHAEFVHCNFNHAELNMVNIRDTNFTWFTNVTGADFSDIHRELGLMNEGTSFNFVISKNNDFPKVVNDELSKKIINNVYWQIPTLVTGLTRRQFIGGIIGTAALVAAGATEETVRRLYTEPGAPVPKAQKHNPNDFELVQSLESSRLDTDITPFLGQNAQPPVNFPGIVTTQPPPGELPAADHPVNAVVLANSEKQQIHVKNETYVVFPKAELGTKTIVMNNPNDPLTLVLGQDVAAKMHDIDVKNTNGNWDIAFDTEANGPIQHIIVQNAAKGFTLSMLGPEGPNVITGTAGDIVMQSSTLMHLSSPTPDNKKVADALTTMKAIPEKFDSRDVPSMPKEVPFSSLYAPLKEAYAATSDETKKRRLLLAAQRSMENDPNMGTNFLNTLETQLNVATQETQRERN